MDSICPPALIYLAFSLTQIIIDTFKGLYNTAFFKFIVMITITFLLNALCQGGMTIISWILVFIPFIFMTVIVTILYVFGLDAATVTLKMKCDMPNSNSNSNLIYTSSSTNTNITNTSTNTTSNPSSSTDPQYQ